MARRRAIFRLVWLGILALAAPGLRGQSLDGARNVLIEVYHRGGHAESADAIAAVKDLQGARGGITLVLRDVEKDQKDQERLDAVLKHFGIVQKKLPVVYGCNRVLQDLVAPATWASQVRELLQVEVFVRSGCSRCATAKQWLPSFMRDYPGLELIYRDVAADRASADRMSSLVARHRAAAVSVPVFHLCDGLVVGFDARGSTEERLRSTLKAWTHVPRKAQGGGSSRPLESRPAGSSQSAWSSPLLLSRAVTMQQQETDSRAGRGAPPPPAEQIQDPEEGIAPLPTPGPESRQEGAAEDDIDLPLFGRLSASKLGMPLFTIAVGLVDGFNPCAMWVLLFLLSILVNLKDRGRILAIAGTFVVISGVAYFAFMAAWLNVFLLIGYLRPIQIALAVLAIIVGAVHIKDFFAFHKGISFSIPEAAKPGIYARVRRIVTAEHMLGAVIGASTLAVLVNLIELLCTSGLPALYTNILMQQGFTAVGRYAHLALYIAAYMADDVLMVGVVVVTLDKVRLQEAPGRWLKLVSGVAIVLLAAIMLVQPEWLA